MKELLKDHSQIIFQISLFIITVLVLVVLDTVKSDLPSDPRSYPLKLSLLKDLDKDDDIFVHRSNSETGFRRILREKQLFRFTFYTKDFNILEDVFLENPQEIVGGLNFDINNDGVEELLYTRIFYRKNGENSNTKIIDSFQFCLTDQSGKETIINKYDVMDFFKLQREEISFFVHEIFPQPG